MLLLPSHPTIVLPMPLSLTPAFSPRLQIPTLLIDGHKLSQSLAIMEYLEETRPSAGLGRLLPADDFALRAKIRQVARPSRTGIHTPDLTARALQVCCIICSDTQPIQNLRVLQRVAAMTDGDAKAKEDAKSEWARSWIAAGLAAVEAVIGATAGQCCFGDEVTLADICLVPQVRPPPPPPPPPPLLRHHASPLLAQVYNAARFGVDMSQLPTVARVSEHLASLPQFIAAHPQQQGDAPAAP
jgi:glutathione S-transferase